MGGACGGDDDVADDAGAESGASIGDADSGRRRRRAPPVATTASGAIWPGVEAEDDLLEGVDFTDPEALEGAYQSMIDLVEDAAESAPEEVKADIELTVERSKVIFGALSDADFNILDVDQAVFEDPEAEAASERIEAYNEQCGIADDDVTDDGDATDDTGADSDDGDTLTGEGTIRDELLRQFTAMGMSEDQANCLVDNLDMEEVAASGADNPSMFLDLFETCDINLAELTPPGGERSRWRARRPLPRRVGLVSTPSSSARAACSCFLTRPCSDRCWRRSAAIRRSTSTAGPTTSRWRTSRGSSRVKPTGTTTTWPTSSRSGRRRRARARRGRPRRHPYGVSLAVADPGARAMAALADSGVPMGVVSNASGQIESELRRSGVCHVGPGAATTVRCIVDSHVVGVAKPDPHIFEHALPSFPDARAGADRLRR